MHKRMAHGAMVKPVVKAYADNLSPERLDEVWKLSLAEEPGPVHLDISERMQGTSYERTTLAAPLNSVVPQEIPRRIQVAHTPVVIVGALATRRVWRQRLAALQVPVFTTVAAKGAVDERLPHAAGVFTNSGGPFTPEYQLLPMADLIIGLGLRTSEILDVKALAAPVILLDEMEGTGTGLGAAAEACVDEDGVVAALELLTTKDWGVHEVARARIGLAERLVLDRWLPGGAFHRIQQLLPESTLFVLDTGNFAVIGEHVLEARYPLHVTGSTQGRAMGVAIPRGIGIALGRRGTPVVVAAGDGGIRMYPQEVSLAVQERLPLLVLLMADGFFSGIRRSAIGKGLSENMARLRVLDWCSFFAALGCPAQRVGSFAALADALQAWTPDAGPLFLELVFESHAYMAMTEGIR
jgi:thiamine pyrophosphate-dependent acetolactate synthase large subunit-like protein